MFFFTAKLDNFAELQQRIKEQQQLLEEEERQEELAEQNNDNDNDNDNDHANLDNQEEDSCYHSNDDLDETLQAKEVEESGDKPQQPQQADEDWDSDNLQVSPCWVWSLGNKRKTSSKILSWFDVIYVPKVVGGLSSSILKMCHFCLQKKKHFKFFIIYHCILVLADQGTSFILNLMRSGI